MAVERETEEVGDVCLECTPCLVAFREAMERAAQEHGIDGVAYWVCCGCRQANGVLAAKGSPHGDHLRLMSAAIRRLADAFEAVEGHG